MKRGQIGSLIPFALILVVLVLLLGASGLIVTLFRNSTLALVGGNNSNEAVTLINQGIGGLTTLGSFMGIICTIAVLAIILRLVIASFAGGMGGAR